jgi:hypothetical protein
LVDKVAISAHFWPNLTPDSAPCSPVFRHFGAHGLLKNWELTHMLAVPGCWKSVTSVKEA